MKLTIKRAVLVSSMLLSAGFSVPAFANTGTFVCGSVSQQISAITWDGGALYIDCNGTSAVYGSVTRFYAAVAGDSCNGAFPSADALKVWQSLATAASLSSRSLSITWKQTDAPRCGWTAVNSGDGSNYYYITGLALTLP